MNAELIKQLREEAERLSAHSLDRGVQEAGIAANLAEKAADALEAAAVANKREHYMRGYSDGFKEGMAEMLPLLKEAADFVQPFNRGADLLVRIDAAISKATA